MSRSKSRPPPLRTGLSIYGDSACREEWEWLRTVDTNRLKDVRPSASQLAFHWSVASAARVLLNDLDIGDDQIASHRVYRLEVVEIHSDVSFILLVPSHDDVCLPPGQPRMSAEEKRGCVALPVPMFEVGKQKNLYKDYPCPKWGRCWRGIRLA